MKKWVTTIVIAALFFIISLNGCIEDISYIESNMIYVDSRGGTDYSNIQDAIDASLDNYIIFVFNGTYFENIVIDKAIKLIGEDTNTTIINGNGEGDVIYVSSDGKLNITGFTIVNSGNDGYPNYDAGIDIRSNHNVLVHNNFSNNFFGLFSNDIRYNNFSKNTFSLNSDCGMFLNSNSDLNIIYRNNIINNFNYGIRVKGSRHNKIYGNIFLNNQKGLFFCCGAIDNMIYFNMFINNSEWGAQDDADNKWDNGTIGNYWDDYLEKYPNGTEIAGIWDTPYDIHVGKKDMHPLFNPINI